MPPPAEAEEEGKKMQKINSWNAFGGIIIIAVGTGAFPVGR
jgi:hypothetical protein